MRYDEDDKLQVRHRVALWLSIGLFTLALVLFIAAIWLQSEQLAGTGAVLLVPTVVAALVASSGYGLWDNF